DITIDGNTVYLGGFFRSVGGQPRSYIAAVDARTGAVTEWNPNAEQGVYALAVAGNTVLAAGLFKNIGGQPRNSIAALDAGTGLATDWVANTNPRAHVYSLAVLGDTVFVGGDFTAINRQPRGTLAALDLATGAVVDWDPNPSFIQWVGLTPDPAVVWSLTALGNTLFAGGWFTTLGGIPASCLAAISFAPPVPDPVPIPPKLALGPIAPNPVRAGATA